MPNMKHYIQEFVCQLLHSAVHNLFAIITGIWELSFLHGRILKLSHNTLRCTLTLAAPNKIEESRGFPVKQRSFMSNQAAD